MPPAAPEGRAHPRCCLVPLRRGAGWAAGGGEAAAAGGGAAALLAERRAPCCALQLLAPSVERLLGMPQPRRLAQAHGSRPDLSLRCSQALPFAMNAAIECDESNCRNNGLEGSPLA